MTHPRINAAFHPQELIDGEPVETGRVCYVDVTSKVLAMSLDELASLRDAQDSVDSLVDPVALGHNGPYFVIVTDAVCRYFGVEILSQIEDYMLEDAREVENFSDCGDSASNSMPEIQ